MQQIFKKIFGFFIIILAVTSASAQVTMSVVSGTITEKVLAELWVSKMVNGKTQKIAEFKISPTERNFMFAVPGDSIAAYRIQVNLLKPGTRHPSIDRVHLIYLSLNPQKNYSLQIVPSKLDSTQKKGWKLATVTTAPRCTFIKGKLTGVKFNIPVNFNSVADGELKQTGSYITSTEGDFSIPVQLKKDGFYYLSSPRWKLRLYLHANEKLQLEIDNKTGLITSTNSHIANQLLYQWQQLISPITSYGYNLSTNNPDSIELKSYISRYQELQPEMEKFLNSFDLTDQQEYAALQNAMMLDKELAPLNFLFQSSAKKINGFRISPKEFNEVPEFYKQFIQPQKFANASVLNLGEARQFMKLYALMNLALVPKEKREQFSKAARLQLMMNTISNDTLKSVFFKDQMDATEINNLSEFKETLEPFKKYAKISPAKEIYQSIYGLFSGDTAYIGKTSYNFSLPDTSGKMISMKDFKGKVVFIDVWATWCGPCRAQIPFLKEIEEEYAGNSSIVFVGISTDKVEARQKWLSMIRKEQLGGIQLLDDFGKGFARKYGISAIPRFMLIDKHGKWIEIRCPLPENKQDLKKYLDKALADSEMN